MGEEVCVCLLPNQIFLLQLLHFIHLCNSVHTNGYTGHTWKSIVVKAD